jgi:hypothetical protein
MTEPTPEMHRLAVGQPYSPTGRTYPDGTMRWSFTPSGVELLLAFSHPTSKEIQDVRTGAAQFALLAGDHVLLMAHRFGTMPWSDAPWEVAAQRAEGREPGLADVPEGQSLLVQVVLVDADTGLVRVLRSTTWSREFVEAVRAAIERQLTMASADRAQVEIQALYARYPDTPSLVAAADIRSETREA